MSDSRQLPTTTNLRQLKNQAKDLCRACRESDPEAIRRIGETHPSFSGKTQAEIAVADIALTDAQLVIARELGFDSWPKLKKHVELLSQRAASIHALVTGNDLHALQEAVAQDPESINRPNESGLPPLYAAALYRNRPAIDFLMEHGAVVDIFASAYLGRTAEADALLKRHPNLVRATMPNGKTALHYAAMAGHFEVAHVLLRRHADVNAVDNDGMTSLMEACHTGPWKAEPAEDIIQLLLDHGAQIDLFMAAALGRIDLITSILDRDGSLIDRPDKTGNTALFHAARNNHLAVVKLLVARGADVNRSDAVGIAALHRTSQECSDELIQFLLDHGANAHLCCYVACGDEEGTRRALARNPDAANESFYEFNAVGYAIHSWQLGTLRILLQNGNTLSKEDQQHILRISENDQKLLDELMALQNE